MYRTSGSAQLIQEFGSKYQRASTYNSLDKYLKRHLSIYLTLEALCQRLLEMIFKVRIPDTEPMARLRYEDDDIYPGWYVWYPVAGLPQKVPLSAWNLDDVQGAISEAAELLCISSTQIQCDLE